MKLSQFNFSLPKDLIAQEPPRWRDECRLLVLNRKTGEIEHKLFKDIIQYFGKDDMFVLNDTKVFPARLYGKKEKTGADIEVFLLRELNREQRLWDVIVDPARKIRIGNKLYFGEDESLVAEVIDNTTSRGRTLRFLYDGSYEDFKETLFGLGETPILPWVKPKVTPEDAKEIVQTHIVGHKLVERLVYVEPTLKAQIESTDDGALIGEVLRSAKNFFYAMSRSNAVNGLDSSSRVIAVTPWWQSLLQGVQYGLIALLALSFLMTLVTKLKRR